MKTYFAAVSFAALMGIVALSPSFTSAFPPQPTGAPQEEQNWNQWRGPNRDGTISGEWPSDLGETTLTQIWSVPLGPSYSGPIVAGDLVFVTETREKKDEIVYAFDRNTGEKKWEVQWAGSIQVPFFAKANGDWIRSTPCYDDGKLYVCGIRDLLVCLEAETGKELWKIDFAEKFGTGAPTFGCVCSPLIDGDDLYLQAGGGFCKLDKRTGDLKWRVLVDGGGMNGSAFSSPYIAELNGQRQVLVQMRENLHGVEPGEGKVLWSQPVQTFRGMNILTPSVYEGGVFTSTYGGTTQMVVPRQSQGGYQVDQKWNTPKQGYMSSPVIANGCAFLTLRNKTISCFDLETGEQKWSSPRYGQYSSLITNGEKILALDQTGKLILFRANPEQFELLGERKVSEDSWAHLAIQGNQVFVRELDAITAFRWASPATEPTPE